MPVCVSNRAVSAMSRSCLGSVFVSQTLTSLNPRVCCSFCHYASLPLRRMGGIQEANPDECLGHASSRQRLQLLFEWYPAQQWRDRYGPSHFSQFQKLCKRLGGFQGQRKRTEWTGWLAGTWPCAPAATPKEALPPAPVPSVHNCPPALGSSSVSVAGSSSGFAKLQQAAKLAAKEAAAAAAAATQAHQEKRRPGRPPKKPKHLGNGPSGPPKMSVPLL